MRRFAIQAFIVLIAVAILSGAVARCYTTSPGHCAKSHPCCPDTKVPPCCAIETSDPHGNQPGLAPPKHHYSGIAEVPAPVPGSQFVSPVEPAFAFGRNAGSAGLYLRYRVLRI
jgi:hypothetical protein